MLALPGRDRWLLLGAAVVLSLVLLVLSQVVLGGPGLGSLTNWVFGARAQPSPSPGPRTTPGPPADDDAVWRARRNGSTLAPPKTIVGLCDGAGLATSVSWSQLRLSLSGSFDRHGLVASLLVLGAHVRPSRSSELLLVGSLEGPAAEALARAAQDGSWEVWAAARVAEVVPWSSEVSAVLEMGRTGAFAVVVSIPADALVTPVAPGQGPWPRTFHAGVRVRVRVPVLDVTTEVRLCDAQRPGVLVPLAACLAGPLDVPAPGTSWERGSIVPAPEVLAHLRTLSVSRVHWASLDPHGPSRASRDHLSRVRDRMERWSDPSDVFVVEPFRPVTPLPAVQNPPPRASVPGSNATSLARFPPLEVPETSLPPTETSAADRPLQLLRSLTSPGERARRVAVDARATALLTLCVLVNGDDAQWTLVLRTSERVACEDDAVLGFEDREPLLKSLLHATARRGDEFVAARLRRSVWAVDEPSIHPFLDARVLFTPYVEGRVFAVRGRDVQPWHEDTTTGAGTRPSSSASTNAQTTATTRAAPPSGRSSSSSRPSALRLLATPPDAPRFDSAWRHEVARPAGPPRCHILSLVRVGALGDLYNGLSVDEVGDRAEEFVNATNWQFLDARGAASGSKLQNRLRPAIEDAMQRASA